MTSTSLCIGAGAEQVHAMGIARRLGFRVLAVDRNPNASGKNIPDLLAPIDIANEDAVVQFARKNEVKFVLPAPIGRFLTTVGAVNDALGLPGVQHHSAMICVDKAHCNRVLRASGINMAQQKLIIDWSVERNEVFATCPLPCIVKPRFGSGSRGVRVCRNLQQVEEAVANCSTFGSDVLIEQLVVGTEYGVDAAIFDGHFQLLAIREKVVSADPFRADRGYVTIAIEDSAISTEIRKTLAVAVEAAALFDCLIHADIIVDEFGSVFLIEFSGRPSGMMISSHVLPLLYGFDVIESAILHLAHIKPFPVIEQKQKCCAAMIYFPFPAGKVRSVGGYELAKTIPGIIHVNLAVSPGDELGAMATCQDAISRGYVLATASNETTARSITMSAVEAVMQCTVIDEVE